MIIRLMSPAGADGNGTGQGNGGDNNGTGDGGIQDTMNNADQGDGDSGIDTGESLFDGEEVTNDEGGNSVADETNQGDNDTGQEGEVGDEVEGENNQNQNQQRQQQGGSGLSTEQITAIAQATAGAVVGASQQQQRQQAQERQLTPEEFAQRFNVFQPSNELMTNLRSNDLKVQAAALAQLRDGIVKQATTMAQYQLEIERDKLDEKFNPAVEYMHTQEVERQRNTFWKANPELRKFEKIVDLTATELAKAGKLVGDVATTHKLLSIETKKVLKTMGVNLPVSQQRQNGVNGNGAQNNGGQQNNQRQQNNGAGAGQRSHRMSTLGRGGQNGSGGRNINQVQKGPAGVEVFND